MVVIATYPTLSEVTEGIYPDVATNLGYGDWLGYLFVVGGLASCMGTYTVYQWTGAVAYSSLAEQGTLPYFIKYKMRFTPFSPDVPAMGLLLMTIVCTILVIFDFSVLVEIESFLYVIHTIILSCTLLAIRYRQPNLPRPFKVPGGWVGVILLCLGPLMVALVNMGTLFYFDWRLALIGLGVLCVGIVGFSIKALWWDKKYGYSIYQSEAPSSSQ
eukprot:CAMPEP_0174253078 /NCGR_PEP_ID=MMETSP0439-20130205/2468_1 /TAXON_ID=0 /ORGANISM="Stereomyxa ramosa, Strain Chinc5" /LENGTH=214 /DNA_ID=CAMNT_0015333907 /DNA_START=984 /DNA_END=1625 /DNA_ORIENTATION=-